MFNGQDFDFHGFGGSEPPASSFTDLLTDDTWMAGSYYSPQMMPLDPVDASFRPASMPYPSYYPDAVANTSSNTRSDTFYAPSLPSTIASVTPYQDTASISRTPLHSPPAEPPVEGRRLHLNDLLTAPAGPAPVLSTQQATGTIASSASHDKTAVEVAMEACRWTLSANTNSEVDEEEGGQEDSDANASSVSAGNANAGSANDANSNDANGKKRPENSWSYRNPNRPVIPTKPPAKPLTVEERAKRDALREQKAERDAALQEDVKARIVTDDIIDSLATKHAVPFKTVESMFFRAHDKKSREVRLWNAKVFHEAPKMVYPNGLTRQEKVKMLQDHVREQVYTPEQEQAMIKALEEHRLISALAVRCSNHAANQDAIETTKKIIKLLDDLRTRAGIYGCVMLVRGHVDDIIEPVIYGTDNSEDFFDEQLGVAADMVIRKFESWVCSLNENLDERESNNIGNVRKQITSEVIEGLRFVTQKDNVRMSYENYQEGVVELYGAKLTGWPKTIPMISPSNISKRVTLRRLRDMLKRNEIFWETLDGKRTSKQRRRVTKATASKSNKKSVAKGPERASAQSASSHRKIVSPATIEDSDVDSEAD
ncbi:hypothetical protein CONPUDRAFT_159299 [Coniophora puteana RWD-64-598 SS2]|uniref:Uncharacterized protein n=1 Tax=Coniophora puteana (strain RWD-64-598) TaxID=741705 RepID=A0A5M3M7Z3_CONPW|nr:uncharacterized protein CONPUDRAFT_159299 [Coniophora puteana RWD-64-598 SS2]EIW75167.1 hypothetical protein CONPUDRAFT_159299 [Coniophora puteana RWD-64-598 SS2]